MFKDMRGSAANVSGYEGKCCKCFRIWWVTSIFQDMESSVNVGYIGNVSRCCGKCCLHKYVG